jgi:hypothetical protein
MRNSSFGFSMSELLGSLKEFRRPCSAIVEMKSCCASAFNQVLLCNDSLS